MPGFDGTGPRGEGPMTGGARGYCAVRLPNGPNDVAGGYAGAAGRPFAARLGLNWLRRPFGLGLARRLGRSGRGARGRGRRW